MAGSVSNIVQADTSLLPSSFVTLIIIPSNQKSTDLVTLYQLAQELWATYEISAIIGHTSELPL